MNTNDDPKLKVKTLSFKTKGVGGGEMTLLLAVNSVSDKLFGWAEGTIRQGTQHPPEFSADVAGSLHSTGLEPYTMVGGVEGPATVSFEPPMIGCYLTAFKATFAVDRNWNGHGTFSVGTNTYKCDVSSVE
jgi:hypothetical protein